MYSTQPPGSFPVGLKGPPPAYSQQGPAAGNMQNAGPRAMQQGLPQGQASGIPAQRPPGYASGVPAQSPGYVPSSLQGGMVPAAGMMRGPPPPAAGIPPGARPPMMLMPGAGPPGQPLTQGPGSIRPPMPGAPPGTHPGMRPPVQTSGPIRPPMGVAPPAMPMQQAMPSGLRPPAPSGIRPPVTAQPLNTAQQGMPMQQASASGIRPPATQQGVPLGQTAASGIRPPAVVGSAGMPMQPGQQGSRGGGMSAEGPRYGRRAPTGSEPDRPTWPAGSAQGASTIPGVPYQNAAASPVYRPSMGPPQASLPQQSVPSARPAPIAGSPASIPPRPIQGSPATNAAGWPGMGNSQSQAPGQGPRPLQPNTSPAVQNAGPTPQQRGMSPAAAGLSQLKQAAATRLTQRAASPSSSAAGYVPTAATTPRAGDAPRSASEAQGITVGHTQPRLGGVPVMAGGTTAANAPRSGVPAGAAQRAVQKPAWDSDFADMGSSNAAPQSQGAAGLPRQGMAGMGAPVPVNLAAATSSNRSAALAALAARKAVPNGHASGMVAGGPGMTAQMRQQGANPQAGMQQYAGQPRRSTPPQQQQQHMQPHNTVQQRQQPQFPAGQPFPSNARNLGGSGGFNSSMMSLDMEEQGSVGPLVACPSCGRHFAEQAFAKHAKICEKVFMQKRKAFNSAESRIGGTEAAKYFDTRKGAPKSELRGGGRAQPAAAAGGGKMSKWKMQSEQLRAAMRNQRIIKEAQEAGRDIRTLQFEATPEEIDDRVPCPHCGRKFAPLTAERHIPKCKDTQAKPSFCKAQGGKGAYARMK